MRKSASRFLFWVVAVSAICAFAGRAVGPHELLLVVCDKAGPCSYRRVSAVTVGGRTTIKTVGVEALGDVRSLQKARTTNLASISGLYHEPKLGTVRTLTRDVRMGDIALPSKLPTTTTFTASSAWAGVTLEFREQPKSKTATAITMDQFVALIQSPNLELASLDFARNVAGAAEAHPLMKELVAGAVRFAPRSEELGRWRNELRSTMRSSLEVFRGENADPARLEATLEDGLAAMRVYRLVAADDQKEEALQEELTAEHRRLTQRFAVAAALKAAGLHDPYLEKMDQIGLARWSRPEIAAGIEQSRQASAEVHSKRAKEKFDAKQFTQAFDEVQLASKRAPCNPTIAEYYYRVRVELVNQNMIPAAAEYENANRNYLDQIVRELKGLDLEGTPPPDRVKFFRERIAEGERLDKDYPPLQLQKAYFLVGLREFAAAQEAVTRVERTVQMDRRAAEEWLGLDAKLKGWLATVKETTERAAAENLAKGQFQDALTAAAFGLKAEPDNLKLLSLSARASAVLRDEKGTKQSVERYLRSASSGCAESDETTKLLLDLYRRQSGPPKPVGNDKLVAHWISGEMYRPGEVFYDPASGGFFPQMMVSRGMKGSSTIFNWDGFTVTSISTTVQTGGFGSGTTIFEAEPRYDRQRVRMIDIGSKGNSAEARRSVPLRFVNSPDFDPVLAAKFTGAVQTRGWAGNPFFHPFIWRGIFVFDLTYDELGRIKEAIPVTTDAALPRSPFSETMTFTWEGKSNRLLSIRGARYRREMKYDGKGRLKAETITYGNNMGRIDYTYLLDTSQLTRATCEDNFFDRDKRSVTFRRLDQ